MTAKTKTELPQPPASLADAARQRRGAEAVRLRRDLANADRDIAARDVSMRRLCLPLEQIEEYVASLRQAKGDLERRLALIESMTDRQLVLEYMPESAWTAENAERCEPRRPDGTLGMPAWSSAPEGYEPGKTHTYKEGKLVAVG